VHSLVVQTLHCESNDEPEGKITSQKLIGTRKDEHESHLLYSFNRKPGKQAVQPLFMQAAQLGK
jgi:hypothetical protein